MVWNVFFVFIFSMWIVNSREGYYQPPRNSAVWGYFTPPLLQRDPLKPQKTAMEAMVELTNNLGVAILQDQSFSKGNFAFSPYGVASVLVVLYEGARSESARQIHRAVGFPLDKDIIRVGFRDIHRHLRSYFSHEGYLSGISLNKQGSNLKYEYKKVLKFYGYDVNLNESSHDDDFGSGNNISESSSSNPEYTKTTASPHTVTTTTSGVTPSGDANKDVTNSVEEDENITSTLKSTTQRSVETTMPVVTTTSVTEELAQTSTEAPESKETDEPDINEKTSVPPEEVPQDGTTALPLTEPQEITAIPTTTEELQMNITAENNADHKNESASSDTKKTTSFIDQTETTPLSVEAVTEPETKTTESEVAENINANLDNGMLIPQPDDRETTTETESTKDYSSDNILGEAFSHPDELEIQFGSDIDSNINKVMELIKSRASLWLTEKTNQRSIQKTDRKIRTITDYLKSPHNLDLSLQLQNGMYGTHVTKYGDLYKKLPRLLFLVNGAVDMPVPMMTYTNVFSYAYIPRLHSKALEFPLDDVRYKLLILLPIERRGLRQLIYDLTDYPLSNVLEAMRPLRVKVMVPTFMIEGFVILTSSLQKLGIWDVFDPRKANLSGMSTDPELYVRNVEQSVTVVIRNYVEILDIQTRTMAARQMECEFEATHPFIYFVLDTATNVALMAGQILDPLNSRMY